MSDAPRRRRRAEPKPDLLLGQNRTLTTIRGVPTGRSINGGCRCRGPPDQSRRAGRRPGVRVRAWAGWLLAELASEPSRRRASTSLSAEMAHGPAGRSVSSNQGVAFGPGSATPFVARALVRWRPRRVLHGGIVVHRSARRLTPLGDPLDDPLDNAALAGGVAAFERDADFGPVAHDPLLEPNQSPGDERVPSRISCAQASLPLRSLLRCRCVARPSGQ